MAGIRLPDIPDGLFDLLNLRVSACLQLGVDQLAVHCDFVATPIGGDKRQALDLRAELGKQCFRQTGGFRQIVSHGAVLDLYAHRGSPP